jgi:endonuclease/exonuclease/phosphatase family metal-dependent hydrolase
MAGQFSKLQWDRIEAELVRDPTRYGMPEGGREESMVFASFNIRKLGKLKNRERELDFMARFCARCDLIAIQEVQDDLASLRYLKDRVDERVASAGEYELVVSDITGEVPGERGMAERLAFFYRKNRIKRMDMTSDLTFDRTAVLSRYRDNSADIEKAWKDYDKEMKRHAKGERSSKPQFSLPAFVTFARTPHVTAFVVPAAGNAAPMSFIAVNAHLIYGKMEERKAEFRALVSWMMMRLKKERNMIAPNFILLGDLNLDLDDSEKDREEIEGFIAELKQEALGSANSKRIYFPFIGKHPLSKQTIRTNARQNQTFDQIGFFLGKREKGLPQLGWARKIDGKPDSFNYGVFNFAELFSQVIEKTSYSDLTKTKRKSLGKKFEHSVSDHMPIWVRIPRPGF